MAVKPPEISLAYSDERGNIHFDEDAEPFADAGIERLPRRDELIPAPPGTVPTLLPGRRPRLRRGRAQARTALAALLPAGYTRLLLPAYRADASAPTLPLFGYTFACVVEDALHVAAMRTDARDDWSVRTFAEGELEAQIARRRTYSPQNRILQQLQRCALEYGCFTAQNVFLEQGEAAIPVSPSCNAACVGCISEQRPDAGIPAPQQRLTAEMQVAEIVHIAMHHLDRVPDGIVSFGQGCEGEPLLRATTIARAIQEIRKTHDGGLLNCNTNGSLPKSLQMLMDAGLDAVRISLNSFRPEVYAAYYRPIGYGLEDVFTSVRAAVADGLRVSLNLLTHPGITDDPRELAAMENFFAHTPVDLVQTRTLNIDPERYFAVAGRPQEPVGMREALERIECCGVAVGNFTRRAAAGRASIRPKLADRINGM